MVHSMRAIPLAALFLVALFSGIPDGPSVEAAGTEPPKPGVDEEGLQHFRGWSVGDYWKYSKEATGANNAKTNGEIVYWVQSSERITNERFRPDEDPPEWRSHQVFRVKTWANQTATSGFGPAAVTTEQERYLRTSDLATAQIHAYSDYSFVEAPQHNGNTERYHYLYPPEVQIEFPFTKNDKWRAATIMRNHNPGNDCDREGYPGCNSTTKKVHTYTVLGSEVVTLEIDGRDRDFFTWRILVVDEMGYESWDTVDQKSYDIWWYSPEACNVVMKEEYSARRTRQLVWTLTDYHCDGRTGPDPTYEIYDYKNLSSTRRHGKLAVPDTLAHINKVAKVVDDQDNGLVHLFERSPGPSVLLLAAMLLGAMAGTRRRD